jgi:cytochrome P450
MSGDRTSTIHALHSKYGPVVRIAPNELSFSDINHIKDIYGQSSVFMKSPVYDSFGRRGIFTMRNKEEHRARRKLLSHPFAQSNIFTIESLIVAHVEKLSTRISNSAGTPIDTLHWFRYGHSLAV